MPNAKPPKTLDVEQQLKLLEVLLNKTAPLKTARKGIRNHLIACLMLDAGLRVGEVVKMRHPHLYFNNVPVKSLILDPHITKNHRERTVPVGYRLSEAMRNHLNFLLANAELNNEDFCFYATNPEKPLTTRQVENIINSAALKCFGRTINPHMLRHTFASRLLRVTNMRTVQELLGHNCITSTQIYTHPNEDDKKKAITDIDNNVKTSDSDCLEPPGQS